jgi:hypothetical protein
MKTTSLILILLLFCSLCLATELNNNILQFDTLEARDAFVADLQQNDPGVEVTLLDIIKGCVCKHPDTESFTAGTTKLNGMLASGVSGLQSIHRDEMASPDGVQGSAPWHLDRVDQRILPLNTKFGYRSMPWHKKVNIYVVDTGIRVTHNEFKYGSTVRAKAAYTALGPSYPSGQDCHGHGTHVAGIIGGRTYGVNKNRFAIMHDVRVFKCSGGSPWSVILSALNWVKTNHQKPAIVNMSLGGGLYAPVNAAVKALHDAGVLSVVAAGNSNADACKYSPASEPTALSVGSSTSTDAKSSFSNWGTCVQIHAPGSSVKSAYKSSDSATATMSGTSMASPVVAGIASVLLQMNPGQDPVVLKGNVIAAATTIVQSKIRPLAYLPCGPYALCSYWTRFRLDQLKEKQDLYKRTIDTTDKTVVSMKSDVDTVTANMNTVVEDVSTVKTDVAQVQTEVRVIIQNTTNTVREVQRIISDDDGSLKKELEQAQATLKSLNKKFDDLENRWDNKGGYYNYVAGACIVLLIICTLLFCLTHLLTCLGMSGLGCLGLKK